MRELGRTFFSCQARRRPAEGRLAQSGHEAETRAQAKSAGGGAYFRKPFPGGSLLEAIKTLTINRIEVMIRTDSASGTNRKKRE